jgi:nucleotide-binding universal stress UspA family protein
MTGFARILCPSDFSPYSRRALEVSISLALRAGGEIRALHVVSPVRNVPGRSSASHAPVLFVPEDRAPLMEDLERFTEPARSRGIPVQLAVTEGEVAGSILDDAQAWPADLVVMGTRGVRAPHAWAVGSATESVLRKSPCPVLAVPRPAEDASPGPRPLFQRILCPVDFSEPCRKALEHALALARETGAHLTLLHILEWFLEEETRPDAPLRIPELHLDLGEDARERMRHVVPEEALAGIDHEELVATGRPHRVILKICRERRADLIVLGIHGRRAIDQVLSGATVCHVVREAGVPILAVRPQ